MRIAWCTPFARLSSIGDFSAVVVSELRRLPDVEVDIVYPVGTGGRSEPDPGLELDSQTEAKLAEYDAVYYNIGDHWPYHGDLVRMLRRVPGIVILHDSSLTHLMMTELSRRTDGEVRKQFCQLYGPHGASVAANLRADPGEWPWRPENVENHPLLGLVLDSALGVVTHSEFAAGRVRREYAGDVWSIPLPSLRLRSVDSGTPITLSDFDERQVVLQAGVINRTKCVSTVIDAFCMAGISDRALLVICGFASPDVQQSFQIQVAELGMSDSVRIMGAVSDDELDALRRKATVATVLRYPIGEAASTVLLDSMIYRMAVVTVNAGHYTEVPDDTVLRVESPPSAAETAEKLSYAVSHPVEISQMADRARQYVESQRTVSKYAEAVVLVAQHAGSIGRRRDLAADVCDTIKRVGFTADSRIADRAVETATELFGRQAKMAHEIYERGV